MLAIALAIAMSPGACPMRIGIGADGTVFTNRMHGWYKASLQSMEGELRSECYNDSHPSPITSVTLFLAPDAPKPRVDAVFSVLKKDGWSQDKITVGSWRGYPNPPQ